LLRYPPQKRSGYEKKGGKQRNRIILDQNQIAAASTPNPTSNAAASMPLIKLTLFLGYSALRMRA
jgi:hypothetical protein